MQVEEVVQKHLRRTLKIASELISNQVFNPRRRSDPPRRLPVEKVVNLMKMPRKVLSHDDHKRVILARFGSLEDFTRVRMTITEIHKRLRVPMCTIHKLLRTFEERGCDLARLGRKYERFRMLPPRLRGMLVDESLLRTWIPLTT